MDSGKLLCGPIVKPSADFIIDSSKGGLTIDPTAALVTDLAAATMSERFVNSSRSSFPRFNFCITFEGCLFSRGMQAIARFGSSNNRQQQAT